MRNFRLYAIALFGFLSFAGCATAPRDPRDPAILDRKPAKLLPLP